MQPHTLTVVNVNHALEEGLWLLKTSGRVNESRNGRVVRAQGPVITTYRRPEQRVLFSAKRDANPFFHLYECIWMLAGRKDVASVARFTKQMESFGQEDANGKLEMRGAYGYRWRRYFCGDQIEELVTMISRDPTTRRAVLGMWDPVKDLFQGGDSKDVPCNTTVYFDPTQGVLDMTVLNRSNDIVWGAYGANAVHMSYLHEFMALATGMKLGYYHQFSNNYHLYIDRPDTAKLLQAVPGEPQSHWTVRYTADDRYTVDRPPHIPIMSEPGRWQEYLAMCEIVAEDTTAIVADEFLRKTFQPMMAAHTAYKRGQMGEALSLAYAVSAPDWRIAAMEWIQRRIDKALREQNA